MKYGVLKFFAFSFATMLACGTVAAQQPSTSAQEIFNALSAGQKTEPTQARPRFKTRGLSSQTPTAVDPNADTRDFIRRLPRTRGLSVVERKDLQQVIVEKKLPQINVHIPFGYDSAAITQAALPSLQALATALLQPSLIQDRIALNGHTDAHGSDTYNQSLSERRAIAVRNYLVTTYGVEPSRLIVVGFGEEQPANQLDPFAPENRRVAVVNLSRF